MTTKPVNAIDLTNAVFNIENMLGEKGIRVTNDKIDTSLRSDKGAYSEIYQYISDLITDRPILPWSVGYGQHADAETAFWFSKAPDVNADDEDSSSKYIRGVTQWGLEFAGSVKGLSQEDINAGMQKTSNMIGQLVIQELLDDKYIPDFDVIISKDITAAIGNSDLGNFVQTMGGWGGSFYYWNAHMTSGADKPVSAGEVIENGGTVKINRANTVVQQPSIVEFYYANSNTSADFLTKVGQSDVLRAVNDGSMKELVESVLSIPNPLTIKDVWTSVTTGTQAQAPDNVKKNLIKFTEQACLAGCLLLAPIYLMTFLPPSR